MGRPLPPSKWGCWHSCKHKQTQYRRLSPGCSSDHQHFRVSGLSPPLPPSPHPPCLVGYRVMCHFIIPCQLNYIRNILSLIKAAIGSTWDKTDFKSSEWKQGECWRQHLVSLFVCSQGWVREGGRERERERERKATAKLCRVFVCRWRYSTHPLWFQAYPSRLFNPEQD